MTPLNPAILPEATGNYTHGVKMGNTIFVSGQPPWDRDTELPTDFESQCRLAWRNVLAVLEEGGMGVRDLAKVTIYLSDRKFREANGRVRAEVLGDHKPALTIIIADIYAEDWLLEIEAIAVSPA